MLLFGPAHYDGKHTLIGRDFDMTLMFDIS